MTTLSLSDIDSRLGEGAQANTTQAQASTLMGGRPVVANETGTQLKLEDIDPRLATSLPPSSSSQTQPPPPSPLPPPNEQPLDLASPQAEATLTGAAAGYGMSKLPISQPKTLNFTRAQVQAAVKSKAANRLQQQIFNEVKQHGATVDKLTHELSQAKSLHSNTKDALTQAEENLRSTGIEPNPPPKPTIEVEPEPPKLSAGAERHTNKMSEIRTGNKVQRGLEGVKEFEGMGSLPGYSRNSRLIVPSELAEAPVLTPAQLEAHDTLAKAKAAHAESVTRLNKAQMALEKHVAKSPISQSLKSAAARVTEKAAEAADMLEGLKSSSPFLAKMGTAIGKIPGLGIAGGALAGHDLIQAYQDYEKQDYPEMAAHLSTGVGGALMSVPHPYARVAGALVSAPGLAYQGYTYLHHPTEKKE